ncbi:MAG: sodium-dependent transporter [Deferribacteraceae bacterium]|jgi:NSS family neurotransmitter:Na+ symporter|nr:sodium-dependent transporter [Deferribacteraceae bacterium]
MSNPAGRAQWHSGIGFILAAAGSAVGLGNIWKFPGRAYEGGGAAFLIIYILIVAVIGSTVMLAEFTLGRHTKKNVIGAYAQIGSKWKPFGILGITTGFIINCYYIQVGGWVMYYVFSYLFNAAAVYADPQGYFLNFLGAGSFPVLGAIVCPMIFAALAAFVITRGVSKGIERFNKVGMPILFILLIALAIRSVTLPGAAEGVRYMLTPNFAMVTFDTWLAALGQAFFSLSLGMAIMVTYGSYVKKEENLAKNTALICVVDTTVAFLAGMIIVPAVFAAGLTPGKGGSFAFISLAAVFENIPGGAFFGVLFYLLLFFAAITSCISIMEGTVAAVTEQKNISRNKATIGIVTTSFLIGILYTVSQASMNIKGIWWDFTNGLTFPVFGDFMEYLTDRLLIPINALIGCILVAWVWGTKKAIEEVRQGGNFPFKLAGLWSFSAKFIAIIAIATILVMGLFMGRALS